MKKISIIFLLAAIGIASCKKGFLDVNKTPNNPLSVPPTTILPNVTIAMAFANANDLNRVTSALVQHIAGVANQTQAYDVFLLDGSFDNQWNSEIYNGCLNNLQVLIDQYSNTSPAYSGIAKLEMAYVYSMTTNLWGDIPYSQAGQGLKYETPRFDKQEDIYMGNAGLQITGLMDLVRSGMADLDKTSILKPGVKDDLVYGGNLTKWKMMGNTLLLKLAIQISNRFPAVAASTIQAVVNGSNYINDNSLDFEVPFASATGNRNPIFDFNNNLRLTDQMLSSRYLALSRSLNDTVRLARQFTKPLLPSGASGTPTFVGFNNGSTAAAPTVSITTSGSVYALRSKYNTYLTGSPEPLVTGATGGQTAIRLLTCFQANFIIAEAMTTLGVTHPTITADSFYKMGIKAHMQKTGMTGTDINTYFTTNPTVVSIATGTTAQKVEKIITQKYIAWVGNGIEAFDDYRRTGYSVLTLPLNAQGDNPNVIPTRLPYTPNELARNPNAPNPRPKTDVKVWWAL